MSGDAAGGSPGASTPGESPSGDPSGPVTRRLRGIRTDPDRRRLAVAVATIVGLSLAWLHWFGLVLAGALVGLVSRSARRAVIAGLGVGVLALVLHVWASPAMGPGEFLALTPASYVTVAAGLALPVLGSLVRGVV